MAHEGLTEYATAIAKKRTQVQLEKDERAYAAPCGLCSQFFCGQSIDFSIGLLCVVLFVSLQLCVDSYRRLAGFIRDLASQIDLLLRSC